MYWYWYWYWYLFVEYLIQDCLLLSFIVIATPATWCIFFLDFSLIIVAK